MRIGFITYAMDRPLTGIGRVTLELARAFETLTDEVEVVLLLAGGLGVLSDTPLEHHTLPGCRMLPGLLTLGHGLIPLMAKRLKLDIIHDPTAVTPMLFGAGGARIVSSVHDVIPISYPQNSSTLDTLIYTRWLPFKLPRVDAIITDSEHAKSDIVRLMHVPSEQVHVTYYGARDLFRPIPLDEARTTLRTQFNIDFPYLLYVGNLTKRKNIELALRGFAQIHTQFPDVRFVVVGPSTFRQTPVGAIAESLGIADKVVVTGAVPDAALPVIYSAAEVFVFPSFYEGFGLPVVEAMACGTPVITSNATSLPEVVGDAGFMVDPNSVDEMVTALTRVLNDPQLRQTMREKGLERTKQFTWKRTAQQTIEVYRKIG